MNAKEGTVNQKTMAVLCQESKKTNKIKTPLQSFVEQRQANSDFKATSYPDLRLMLDPLTIPFRNVCITNNPTA